MEEDVYGRQLKETYMNTDKVGSLSGIYENSYDLVIDDLRVLLMSTENIKKTSVDFSLIKFNHIPTFGKVVDVEGFSVYTLPMTSRPLTRLMLSESSPTAGYIGAFEIVDQLAAVLAHLHIMGMKLDNLTLKSVVLCPGEETWLRLLPDTFDVNSLQPGEVADYASTLDFNVINPVSNRGILKERFRQSFDNFSQNETTNN